jgi:hypothetical protein
VIAAGLAARLAAALPDEPRWLETRAMLRAASPWLAGGPTPAEGFVVRVLDGALSAISVVGAPAPEAIVRATDEATSMTPIIAQEDNAAHVQRCLGEGWRGERAILHRLGGAEAAGGASGAIDVRLLAPSDPIAHVPAGLRFELTHARARAPVAAAFMDGVPVSFCYPCWTSESLWDVSIDTLEPHRGRGLAQLAARFMIDHLRGEGREPVWGALESNAASRRLAGKLGFSPVGSLVVFSRGPWAFFTRGFEAGPPAA